MHGQQLAHMYTLIRHFKVLTSIRNRSLLKRLRDPSPPLLTLRLNDSVVSLWNYSTKFSTVLLSVFFSFSILVLFGFILFYFTVNSCFFVSLQMRWDMKNDLKETGGVIALVDFQLTEPANRSANRSACLRSGVVTEVEVAGVMFQVRQAAHPPQDSRIPKPVPQPPLNLIVPARKKRNMSPGNSSFPSSSSSSSSSSFSSSLPGVNAFLALHVKLSHSFNTYL